MRTRPATRVLGPVGTSLRAHEVALRAAYPDSCSVHMVAAATGAAHTKELECPSRCVLSTLAWE